MIMKTKAILLGTAALMFTLTSEKAIAQIGTPYIHDPSTIMECDGKYYTFGTGGGGLISEDGWTWNGGGVRPGGGAAPDAVKIGDRYLVAYSATGGGLGGGHSGKVLTMWNKTLDPNSPDFKYTEPIEVASSAYDEDCDAIDAGLLLDPTDGRLWLSYGTYFGFIRLVELDPATGKRMEGNKEIDIAIDCEATDLIYRDGWYYLLGTHGTCCDGPNSTYNIVVGRLAHSQHVVKLPRRFLTEGFYIHSVPGSKVRQPAYSLGPAFPPVRTENKHALFNQGSAARRTYPGLYNILALPVLLGHAHNFGYDVVGAAHPYPAAQLYILALNIPFIIKSGPLNSRASNLHRLQMSQGSYLARASHLPAYAAQGCNYLLGKKFISDCPAREFIRIPQRLARPEIGQLDYCAGYLKIQALPPAFYFLKLLNYVVHIIKAFEIRIDRKPLLL